jgi:hypothetical protein
MGKHNKVVRVDEKEFETEDGAVYPHLIELEEVPTVEEFQKIYDYWRTVLDECKGKVNQP